MKRAVLHGIREMAKQYGTANLLFLVPMSPLHNIMGISFKRGDDKKVLIPCKIEERWNRTVEENYKLVLKSMIEGYGTEDIYVSDLQSIIKAGHIQLYVMPELKHPLSHVVEEEEAN